MKRAALYARVSTDKQEREETIESQLDALYHAVEAGAYEIPPGCVFVDGPGGTLWVCRTLSALCTGGV